VTWIVPKRKQWIWISLLCFTCLLITSVGLALDVNRVPNPRQSSGSWVTDMAHLLKPATIVQMNQMITNLETKNGSEVAVVTVPETKPAASPKEFATSLFNKWQIGKKDLNNGVLLLVSKHDRRVEIETGYGVESILPDARVGQIISSEMTPRFKQGDYNAGVLAGTSALVNVLSKEYTAPAHPNRANPTFSLTWIIWVFVLLLSYRGIRLASRKLADISLREATLLEPNGRFNLEQKKESLATQRNLYYPDLSNRSVWFLLIGFSSFGLLSSLVCLLIQFFVFVFGAWEQSLVESTILLLLGLTLCLAPIGSICLFYVMEGFAKTRLQRRLKDGYFRCKTCHSVMNRLDDNQLVSFLTRAEQVAQSLGTLSVEGWRCKKCQSILSPPGVHLQLRRPKKSEFEVCPTCAEQTVTVNPTIAQKAPTGHGNRIGIVVKECQCCHQRQEIEQPLVSDQPSTLNRSAPSSKPTANNCSGEHSDYSSSSTSESLSSSSSDSSTGSSWSASSDSSSGSSFSESSSWSSSSDSGSFSDSGSSWSSSDFGGGSSGGGGAGDSW